MSEGKLRVPRFETEAEEADWWADNQDLVAEHFESAAADGKVQRGSLVRQAGEQSGAGTPEFALDPEDVSRVRALATRRGLRYDTYLKMLVHQALEAEERKQAS